MHRHCREVHEKNRDRTSAKQYQCPIQPCDRRGRPFKRKTALRSHLQQVHGRSDYSSESCVTTNRRPRHPTGLIQQVESSPYLAALSPSSLNPSTDELLSTAEYTQGDEIESGNQEIYARDDDSGDDDEVCRDFIQKLNAGSEQRKRILEESHLQLRKRLQDLDEEEKEARSGLRYRRETIRRRKAERRQHSG